MHCRNSPKLVVGLTYLPGANKLNTIPNINEINIPCTNEGIAINSCAIGIVLSVIGVTLSILLDQVLLAIISFLGTSSVNDSFRLCTRVIPDIKLMKKRLDLFDGLDLEVVRQ